MRYISKFRRCLWSGIKGCRPAAKAILLTFAKSHLNTFCGTSLGSENLQFHHATYFYTAHALPELARQLQ